ncbi:MAG: hypothetical protein EXQ98_04680 [Alphaproteobacteria bacterium]|nr:hypothetical protein [Alphaproteobacteria bacterium]
MTSRKPVDPKTLSAVASEIAGLRISAETAKNHAAIYEPILQGIEGLRRLNLKNVEPAVIFHPIEGRKEGGR